MKCLERKYRNHSDFDFILLSLNKYGQTDLLTLSQYSLFKIDLFYSPILSPTVFRSLPAFPILAQDMIVGEGPIRYFLSVIWLAQDQL